MTDEELLDTLKDTWASLGTLLDSLPDSSLDLPTDCPGWSVRDQFSHLNGFESEWFLGRYAPTVDGSLYPHVKNELGGGNEAWVAERKYWTIDDLRHEFHDVVRARLVQLNSARYFPQGLDTVITSFRGDETMRSVLETRLFDVWIHEQDIRRAVAKPGNIDGPAMIHALDRMLASMPWVAAKQAKLDEGSVVAVTLFGSRQITSTVMVTGGRGKMVHAADHRPAAAITMHEETFLLITTGRTTIGPLIDDGKITLRGNRSLAESMALALRVLFL